MKGRGDNSDNSSNNVLSMFAARIPEKGGREPHLLGQGPQDK